MAGMKADGGPAFPSKHGAGIDEQVVNPGMTLRDYFAGLALQGLVRAHTGRPYHNKAALQHAKSAYDYADAMLGAREK